MTNQLIEEYSEPITIERRAANTFVNGQQVKGGVSTVSTRAVVMPMAPDDIRMFAEGQENKAGITIYSEVEIRTAVEASRTNVDVILWDSRRWQVMKVQYRAQIPDLAHYKAMAFLEDAA